MGMMAAPVLAGLCLSLAVPIPLVDKPAAKAKDAKKELAALEQKLLGQWEGSGCDGNLLFRADGTYTLTDYGPGRCNFAGTWKVRGDTQPPTLVLTLTTSQFTLEAGATLVVKLIRLDNKRLTLEYVNENGSPSGLYKRAKK